MTTIESKPRNFWPARIAAALLIILVIGSMAFAAMRTQTKAKNSLEDRFAVRASSASAFLDSYVKYTLVRQQDLAKLRLGSPEVTHSQFLDFLDNFGFGPSVLVDDTGRIIDIAPYKEDLIGKQISTEPENEHLRRAVVNGEQTVSNVIPSDALKFPNVAFATPFQSQGGTRVISGAFDLTTKPLGNYFENIVPGKNSAAYLIDGNGEIIASDDDSTGNLTKVDNALSKEIAKADSAKIEIRGYYKNQNDKKSYFVAHKVNGTPWTVVTSIEKSTLLEPESGSKRVLPWLFLSCFAWVAIILVVLLVRDRERRLRLQDVSMIDLLTGVYNPRGLKTHLGKLISTSRRHEDDLSVFKIDIDNFDSFNNKFGRHVGDEILNSVAEQIQSRLRNEDIVGRSGGEEFTVLLPNTDVNGASIVAERIRRGVEEEVVSIDNNEAKVTISIGITEYVKDDSIESITSRADLALKEAKTSGKNKVVTSNSATIKD